MVRKRAKQSLKVHRVCEPAIGARLELKPTKKAEALIGGRHHVQFVAVPSVGDLLSVDQYSIKQIHDDRFHKLEWRIVSVAHAVNLHADMAIESGYAVPVVELVVSAVPTRARKKTPNTKRQK